MSHLSLRKILPGLLVALILAAGCTGVTTTPAAPGGTTPASTAAPTGAASPPAAGGTVILLTHSSWAASPDVLAAFESETGITVDQRPLGDAGEALSRVIVDQQTRGANAPALGDVLYGVDNTLLGRALAANIYAPYKPVGAEALPAEFVLDPEWRVTPIDYGDVCLNYDKAYFAEHQLAVPQSLADLAKPEYKDLLVVENASASSPGLAFLLATVAQFGEDGYLDYWRSLKDNGVKVVEDWNAAYYTEFSGSSGRGPRPLVVSYASSPPAEVVFAPTPEPGTPPPAEAPTGAITAPGTCFRQVEFAGVLAGAPNAAAAQKLVDFLLDKRFQEDMPLNMFVYPVNPAAQLPGVFTQYAAPVEQPATLPPDQINAGREGWVQAWTELMLR